MTLRRFRRPMRTDLMNVPSVFWIGPDGEIEVSRFPGWSRQEIEEIARKAREATDNIAKPLFQPGENIADFRAG